MEKLRKERKDRRGSVKAQREKTFGRERISSILLFCSLSPCHFDEFLPMPHLLPPQCCPIRLLSSMVILSSLCGRSCDLLMMGASESWRMKEMTIGVGDLLVRCSWSERIRKKGLVMRERIWVYWTTSYCNARSKRCCAETMLVRRKVSTTKEKNVGTTMEEKCKEENCGASMHKNVTWS